MNAAGGKNTQGQVLFLARVKGSSRLLTYGNLPNNDGA